MEGEGEGAGREGAVLERRAYRLSYAACLLRMKTIFFASCLLRKKP